VYAPTNLVSMLSCAALSYCPGIMLVVAVCVVRESTIACLCKSEGKGAC